jgi:thiol-disulfide isomerase/thioredoxin
LIPARRHRLVAAALLAVALGPALTGCGSLRGTSGQSYIEGEGTVTEVKVADRAKPVELSGTTLDGDKLSIADLRGDVVVINIWGAWCPSCRKEMPDLVAVANGYAEDSGVRFVGIDVRESSADNGRAFVRTFKVPYPSLDDQGGESLLALRGVVPPTATPSTLVLDAEGRVAARVLGPIPSRTTLKDLIEAAGGPGE